MTDATNEQTRLSRRAAGIGESATLGVSRKAKELAAQGIAIVDLSAGEPDFPSPECAVEAARAALADGFTRYTPAAGIPELRAALAERYAAAHGTPWQSSDVMVSVGGKGALFELALALFDDGDEVVIPSPYWVTFPEHIRFCGATMVTVDTSVVDGFRIHADAVLAALTPRTRAILLNSPCNPTGGIVTAEDLRTIVAAAAERGVVVLSDETYERFVYDGRPYASAAELAAEYPDTVVVISSFSKTYAMTGWRLGYALGPEEILGAALNIQSHATSNATSFAMKGAVAALAGAEDEVVRMVAEFGRRRDQVSEALEEIPGVSCRPPDGAFYVFPNVAACYGSGRQGSVELAEYLLNEAQVAVVPGVAFGDDDHIRISFATSREALREGLGRIAEALAKEI
jgi:aspartate aminotransferase